MTKLSGSSTDLEKIEWLKEIFQLTRMVKKNHYGDKWNDEMLLELFNEIDIRNLLPEPDIVYKEKEYKTTEQQRMLAQAYRERMKREKEIKEKHDIIEARKQNALKREKALCYRCSKSVELIEKTVEIIQKPHREKKHLLLHSKCSECGTKLTHYTGRINDN